MEVGKEVRIVTHDILKSLGRKSDLNRLKFGMLTILQYEKTNQYDMKLVGGKESIKAFQDAMQALVDDAKLKGLIKDNGTQTHK